MLDSRLAVKAKYSDEHENRIETLRCPYPSLHTPQKICDVKNIPILILSLDSRLQMQQQSFFKARFTQFYTSKVSLDNHISECQSQTPGLIRIDHIVRDKAGTMVANIKCSAVRISQNVSYFIP